MAGTLVGGAVLSAFLQVAFDRLGSRDVVDYFRGSKLDEMLPKKLNIMLLSINTVIDDAEVKQFTDPNVKAWLDEVKDVVYDAEDVLGEIDYELTRRKMEAETQTTVAFKVRNFFVSASVTSFDKDIQSRMKQVLDNLEFLENRKIVLGLKQGIFGHGVESVGRVPTTSLVDETKICGRDDDKEMIINWLLSDSNENGSHFSVISIVGMGGLGKTTLAQLVYNDQRVKDSFDIEAWICVSDDFDVLRLTRTIFEAITMSNVDSNDLNMLQIKLKEELTGKKFLIVLDDVWAESYDLWEAFQTPFLSGAGGSKIVVSTRSNKVALATCSNEIYHLKQLSDDDGWLLFTKYAFRDAYCKSNLGLEEIGREIVKKCKGLPLALKTIGSLLHTKMSFEEWNNILGSEIWKVSNDQNNILPALRLSYHYLPSHLKRCFTYCSLFPKDYEFDKEQLVLLWMAEGFLQDPLSNKEIEEVGYQYFDDLASRSFFQKPSVHKMIFVMHDLLHDLAEFVSGKFYFRLTSREAHGISKVARHFSFRKFQNEESKRFEGLHAASKIRTFLPVLDHHPVFYWMSSKIISDSLSKCNCLQVLSLFNYFNITELPDSISNLIHLRYLDLSYTGISKLPDSTCVLYNLQTLKLANCKRLEELPSDLHKLINLRHLHLQNTKLKKIPKHLGKLKNIQVLTSFYVGEGSESNIKQLGKLNLRGTLSILELQNVVHPADVLATNLKDKRHLDELVLEWSEDNDDSQNERDVLEKLQPHQNLKRLSVRNYGGTRLPDWIADSTLSNLVSLGLENCKYCLFLPSLGILPSLKSLSITGLEGIVAIGSEFFGDESSTVSFGSLEFLKFKKMENWEEWECVSASRAFPCLKELHIKKCPKLKGHLPGQLASLEILQIKSCEQLVATIPQAPALDSMTLINCGQVHLEYQPSTLKFLRFSGPCTDATLLEKIEHTIANTCIEKLEIFNCPNLEFPLRASHNSLVELRLESSCGSLRSFPMDLFPKLQSLRLIKCSNLETISVSVGCEHELVCLIRLSIWKCPKFVSLGEFFAPRLEWCRIRGSESLKPLPVHINILFPSLSELEMMDCPEMESFPEGGLPSKLTRLTIWNCPKLVASIKEWDLRNHTSLDDLFILDAVLECFPEPGMLPPTLSSLYLAECSNLTRLDYGGLCHISSLKRLTLNDCPRLECLPKEGLPSWLSYLEIRGDCPLLKQRCQKVNGQDWGKVARIPCVKIDDDIIT